MGKNVDAGTLIGVSGNSGWGNGNGVGWHLHLGYYDANGKPQDPMKNMLGLDFYAGS